MISVISLFKESEDGTRSTCVIHSSNEAIVPEIEAILSSIYKEQPAEFIEALGDMMERLNAKNNTSN